MNLHPILIFLLICLIQQIIFAVQNCNDPNAVSNWCIDLSLCRPNPICTFDYDPVCGKLKILFLLLQLSFFLLLCCHRSNDPNTCLINILMKQRIANSIYATMKAFIYIPFFYIEGCDENTYSNSCIAEANAIRTVLHKGVCIPMMKEVPTKQPTICDKNDSKKNKDDNDDNIDIKCEKILREGQNNKTECINATSCRVRPVRCTREYIPVCGKSKNKKSSPFLAFTYHIFTIKKLGCNGKTYGNECLARTAAVSHWLEGAC